jgi:glycerol-3-phosphate dehydrogenase
LYKTYEEELIFSYDIPTECAKHLVHSYGTMSLRVAQLGQTLSKQTKGKTNFNERIHPDYPFLRSELYYAARFEMAEKPNDILCRRVPIAMLNKDAGQKLINETIEILAKERKWNST